MSSLTSHLVRRGIEVYQETAHFSASKNGAPAHDGEIKLPAWGITLIMVTVLLFTFSILAISYTYGEVVATLAAVESPSSTTIITTPPPPAYTDMEDHPDAPLLKGDEKLPAAPEAEILLIESKPLTSSFWRIKRHLRARGGRLAKFRGLHIYILNAMLYNVILGFMTGVVGRPGWMFQVVEILTYTLLTRFQLLWNHIVLSEPSQKSWISRLPARSVAAKAFLPTLAYATITKLTMFAFCSAAPLFGLRSNTVDNSGFMPGAYIIPIFLFLTCSILLILGVQIPAEIAITRVRASLLAEEEQPIIPFDRTFDGEVVSVSEGGKGVLTLKQGFFNCDRKTRMRVLGVYFKTWALQTLLILACGLTVVGELRAILGPQWMEKLVVVSLRHTRSF